MRFPSFIKTGDTLGFVAPSFGCSIEPYRTAFNHSLEKWTEKKFQYKLGPNCYAAEGVYPPTLEYMEEHYGIQIDRQRYTVHYEVFASNIMPDITVLENIE